VYLENEAFTIQVHRRRSRSKCAATQSFRRSPRANAREDAMYLENEAFTIQVREDRWEEEGP
jgi:hypothetical protein